MQRKFIGSLAGACEDKGAREYKVVGAWVGGSLVTPRDFVCLVSPAHSAATSLRADGRDLGRG